jgi:hypothetical protein
MKAASTRSKILASSTLALLFLSGAIAGSFISIADVAVLRMALAFGTGTVSYFVTHELLIAPRQRHQAPAMAGIFCLGFFALLVIDVVAK